MLFILIFKAKENIL